MGIFEIFTLYKMAQMYYNTSLGLDPKYSHQLKISRLFTLFFVIKCKF